MSIALLDSHVVYWWSSEPTRLSSSARRAIDRAGELAVAAVSWYELAWLAVHGRIKVPLPTRSWLEGLSEQIRTVGLTPAIGETAAALPDAFPRDPIDRIIYATAIEHGWRLVSKDERMRSFAGARQTIVW
ncbi:MAG TPA: PIN domain-containing protein [Dehalococcoidia bacterium]|nr:PIN domain-containing protein [Dehalococcoidia bacterium]